MFIIQCGKPELPPPYYSKGAVPAPHSVHVLFSKTFCYINAFVIKITICEIVKKFFKCSGIVSSFKYETSFSTVSYFGF